MYVCIYLFIHSFIHSFHLFICLSIFNLFFIWLSIDWFILLIYFSFIIFKYCVIIYMIAYNW